MLMTNERNLTTPWRKDGDWKARYSRLYSSSRRISLPQIEEHNRISFLSNESTPYTGLLMRMRSKRQGSDTEFESRTILAPRSVSDNTDRSDSFGVNDTLLLDMVRAQSRSMDEEALDKPLALPRDDISDDETSEACVHGLSMRMTERSISRSRISRISTRRDMDIPSILAFTTTTPAPIQMGIPAFQKSSATPRQDLPRWSIRRSVCPVCSQKWKDRSSITNVKSSGLKRNSSSELPSVIAPARLRTSITLGYVPRPTVAALDEDAGLSHSGLRNTSAAWQLTRARRFRTPKLQMPPPEATAPPSAAAPLARKDLDLRVNRFLADKEVKFSI